MARLGYERFGAQGGDWGSAVTSAIGALDPRALRRHPREHADGAARPARRRRRPSSERAALDDFDGTPRWGTGLPASSSRRGRRRSATGSPTRRSGSCAWIVEKFWAVDRLRRRPAEHLHPRPAARQRDGLLVPRHRRVVGAASTGRAPPRSPTPTRRATLGPVTVPTGARSSRARLRGRRVAGPSSASRTSTRGTSSTRAATSPRSSNRSSSSTRCARRSAAFDER